MWSRSGGTGSSADGQSFSLTLPEAYSVTHSPGESIPTILTASDGATSIPQLGDEHSSVPGAFCTSIGNVERVGPIYSIVPVEFTGRSADGTFTSSPVNQPPEIDFVGVSAVEEIDTDINGQPLTNVNGELVYGITDDIWDYVLTVKRNFLAWDMYALRLYSRSYNSDEFFSWPAGTAKLLPPRIKPIVGSNQTIDYYQVTAQVKFRDPYNTVAPHAWWKRYRNEGLYIRNGGTTATIAAPTGDFPVTALAYPVVNDSGGISDVVVVNRGRGYESAPTVTITGDGSGATATASLVGDEVGSVSVSAAGTGYKKKFTRALDDNKEPVTTPVLLTADGKQENNVNNAVWIERPTKRPLPYSALGLL